MTAQTARISPTNLPKLASCKKVKKPEGTRLRRTISPPFPSKLHDLLEDVEKEGSKRDIVSWLPDGKAFKVHKPIEFCKTIMKRYFKQSQYKSFTRQVSLAVGPTMLSRMIFLRSIMHISLTQWFLLLQLYLYGFSKIPTPSTEAGAFMHPDFIRGNKQSCITIQRNQVTRDRRWKKDSTQYLPAGQSCWWENIKPPQSMFQIRNTFDDAVPNKEAKKALTMFEQTFFFSDGDPNETAVLSHDSDEDNPADLMSLNTWPVPSMKDDSHHPILEASFFEWAHRRSLDDMHFFDLLEPRPIKEMMRS
jgi:hypothetical protein